MRRYSSLFLLAAGLTLASANKKAGIFNKMANVRTLQAENLVDAGAAAVMGNVDLDEVEKKVDAFVSLEDKQWGWAEKAFAGDILGAMKDSMLTNPQHVDELTQAWANPTVLGFLVDNTPFFKVIKPLQHLGEVRKRGLRELTAEDGINAVGVFQGTMMKLLDTIESVRDPQKMAERMYNYANLEDEKWKGMIDRMQKGDREVQMEMQQWVVDREMGDLIDLEAMGFNGVEPEFLSNARKAVMDQEPGLWNAVFKDAPLAKRYMEDPHLAGKEAFDLTMEYAKLYEGKTTADLGTASA